MTGKLTRETITKIVRDVAELPDRTSPDDQPDMMLVTAEELQAILARHFSNMNLDQEAKNFDDLPWRVVDSSAHVFIVNSKQCCICEVITSNKRDENMTVAEMIVRCVNAEDRAA